jgi:hypothetical protein
MAILAASFLVEFVGAFSDLVFEFLRFIYSGWRLFFGGVWTHNVNLLAGQRTPIDRLQSIAEDRCSVFYDARREYVWLTIVT